VTEITIPEDYTTVLFRICQECLTNIIRYAHATEVKITLMEKGGNLVLEIEYNGKGITTEQLRSPISLGILGMRERIVSLKGTFSISGAPGKGTKVRVKVPVK
jgi:signal transduction histidine kinase